MSVRKPRSGKTALIGVALIIIAAVWGILRFTAGSAPRIPGETNGERVKYIESFGWDSDTVPSKVEEVRIPSRFDEAYEQYNALQKEQGFDLRKYRACFAQKFTYPIRNFDGADPAVPICANLLVIDGEIVGADISSAEANGLVTVLAKK